MRTPPRDFLAHALRLAACLLLLAAAAVAQRGRVLGLELRPGPAAAQTARTAEPALWPAAWDPSPSRAAIFAVLLLAAVMPLVTKSRRWRTAQLWLDVAVLGLWTGSFLSTARLVGWAGAGLPRGAFEWAIALLLLSMAFLHPLFGRPSHYCLHACPFGAAQELVGRLPARKWRLGPSLVRRLTALRRALWAALMLAAWCGAWTRWTEWELFGAFAWAAVPPLVVALAAVFLVLAVFTPRPYCRFVCPTGTLFKLAESNRPEPSTQPPDPQTSQPPKRPAMKAANFLNAVLAVALLLLCAKLHFLPAPSIAAPAVAASAESTGPGSAAGQTGPDSLVIDSTALAPDVRGFAGPVPVEVEIRDGRVARVSPKLPNDETPGFFKRLDDAGLWKAWDGLPVEVAATTRVDTVTSATYSSRAAIANVRAALAAASSAPAAPSAPAPAAADVRLPDPARAAMPLGQALEARATHREFSSEPLSDQELSDLLWAANGYNRPAERKRTAPTAINRQEIDLYVCRADGAYRWDAAENTLRLVCTNDLRGLTGRMNAGANNFALAAPVALVYMVDFERQGMRERPQDAFKYASVDCGFVGQNVYLHCAAAGLNTVFLGSLRPAEIAAALGLPETSVPLFAQTVGKRP